MIKGLNHVTLAVADVEAAFTFYKDVLDCQPLARWQRGAYLLAGDVWLCLSLDPATRSAPLPEYTHLAFTIAADDFANWRSRLDAAQVPQWQENTSDGNSLYFLDPDGHKLELHVGDWRSRLASARAAPFEANMTFFV
ncbi:MAG: fosfomycin resistance glutathione transferase [Cyanobacteria bacterium J06626_18]